MGRAVEDGRRDVPGHPGRRVDRRAGAGALDAGHACLSSGDADLGAANRRPNDPDDGHRIDTLLRLEPAPGHTPGSSVARLETGAGAAFVGHLVHIPVQIGRPDDACAFDLDAGQARVSRRAALNAAARTGATVFPAHFTGRGATSVSAAAVNGFRTGRWAPLDPA